MSSLSLTVVLSSRSEHNRQGVALLSPVVMAALGLTPGDVVALSTGATSTVVSTTATALLAGDSVVSEAASGGLVVVDEVTLSNLAVGVGSKVEVSRCDRVAASRVVLGGDAMAVVSLDAPLVRTLLAGKSVSRGDLVALTPQEVTLVPDLTPSDLVAAKASLRARMGAMAFSSQLRVLEVSPSVATITPSTEVVLGSSSTTSAASVVREVLSSSVSAARSLRDRARPATAAAPAAAASARAASATSQAVRTASSSTSVPADLLVESVTPRVSLSDLPHLSAEAKLLREWFDLGFNATDVLARFHTRPQTGVLLCAPEGSGEVDLVAAVAADLDLSVRVVSGRLFASLDPAKALGSLMSAVSDASGAGRCVLVVTEVDFLASRSTTSTLTPSLLELLTETLSGGRVAVVGTTSRLEEVHPDVRRPGRLEHLLEARVPDRSQRVRLLDLLLGGVPVASDLSLDDVAARTPGFVLADLRALVQEASRLAASRAHALPLVPAVPALPLVPAETSLSEGQLSMDDVLGLATASPDVSLVTQSDLVSALSRVRPSVMSGSTLDVGSVTLDDVGGMEDVKALLTETVLWPLTYPDTFSRMGISPPRGVLLYGPPGCGKTFLVKAVAASGQANVFSVKGSELLSKWVGDSEQNVRELFRKAREASPSIVFLDEVDALAPQRGSDAGSGVGDRVVAALLTELDGARSMRDVVVIGATNRPDLVDSALLRPGRLEQLVYAPPPGDLERAAILRVSAQATPVASDVDWDLVADLTDGYSSADLAAVVRQAALAAMRESMDAKEVSERHVRRALGRVRPSLVQEQVDHLAAFAAEHSAC